ncbi:hypothetical protein [Yoonia sp. TsM2_T14_4]|uniref:hypothetical protein n=1 Tax=Yoonia sp. TsM2_T14_4 TaxID=3415141 RepID=UPI003C72E5FE
MTSIGTTGHGLRLTLLPVLLLIALFAGLPGDAAMVMPVVSHVNHPVAPAVADTSGRHPAIIIPPPRAVLV